MQFDYSRFTKDIKSGTEKGESVVAFLLVAFLTVFPFVNKLFQGVFHLPIMDSDVAIIQFMFALACLSGFVTWHEHRHLSLASLSDRLPHRAQEITECIKSFMTAVILTALFCDSLCQLLNPAQFDASIWHISLRIFFAMLPACYILIMAYNFVRRLKACGDSSKKSPIGKPDPLICCRAVMCVVGFFVGLYISSGTILGSLYYLFNVETNPFLEKCNNAWLHFSSLALWPTILLLIVSAFMGVPLFLVLGGVSYLLFSNSGGYVDVIPMETYRILTDRNTCAIPLFTIAGFILSQSKAGERYVLLFKALFGSFRGGTVIASVIVVTLFSTFTGVSGVTILALGGLLSIALTGSGYDKGRAESLVTASGAIGLLFPPSAAIIMYATVNYFYGIDVFDLFKAALIPGLIMMASMIVLGIIYDTQKTRVKFSLPLLTQALLNALPELFMPLLMCIFYFKGVFDLYETASFAVIYAYLLTTLRRYVVTTNTRPGTTKFFFEMSSPDFTFNKARQVIYHSVPVFGGVIFILGAAAGISYYVLDAGLPEILTSLIKQYVNSKFLFLILMNIALLFVGCIMDMFSAILIVSPLLLPLASSFDVSLLQAAVIFLMNLSIGFLTPPIGMDLFISSYTFNKPMGRVVKGIVPFLIVQFVVLMLVTYVPFFTSVIK